MPSQSLIVVTFILTFVTHIASIAAARRLPCTLSV
jgi:hypothetical protein